MPLGDEDSFGMTVDQLPQPYRDWIERLEANRDHPVRRLFYSIGNGFFEDDSAVSGLPVPGPVYRFHFNSRMAYVWDEEDIWVVRPWQRMKGQVSNAVSRFPTFRAALDFLTPKHPWWEIWGE